MILEWRINARLHSVFVRQQNIFADRPALVLGDGAHQGEDQAAGGLIRADVFLLEDDGHVSGAQQFGIALTLHDVAGEAGDTGNAFLLSGLSSKKAMSSYSSNRIVSSASVENEPAPMISMFIIVYHQRYQISILPLIDHAFKISLAFTKSPSSILGEIIPVSNFIFGVRKLSSGKAISNRQGSILENHSV